MLKLVKRQVCLYQLCILIPFEAGNDCPSSNFKETADANRTFTTKRRNKRGRPAKAEDSSSAIPQTASKKLCQGSNKPPNTFSLFSDIAEKINLLKAMSVHATVGSTPTNLLHGSQLRVDDFQPSQITGSNSSRNGPNDLPLKESRCVPLHCNRTDTVINSTNLDLSSTPERITIFVHRPLVQPTVAGSVMVEQAATNRKNYVNAQPLMKTCNTDTPVHTCVENSKQVADNAMQGCKRPERNFQPSPASVHPVSNANMESGINTEQSGMKILFICPTILLLLFLLYVFTHS